MNPDGSKFGAVKEVTRERAVVDEKCPKCSHKGLNFYTIWARSVDEGQTVFYESRNAATRSRRTTRRVRRTRRRKS